MAALDETGEGRGVGRTAQRHTTETKASAKTSEFAAYIAVVIGVLIAGVVVSGEGSGPDGFSADQVWLYITILTFGYTVSRGIAKSGSRESYTDEH